MGTRLRFSKYDPWLSILLTGFAGCAGPATPLGSVWSLQPSRPAAALTAEVAPKKTLPQLAPSRGPASILGLGGYGLHFGSARGPTIRFDPPRQVLHGPRTVKVIIDDPQGIGAKDSYDFKVRYHGHDVTRSFLLQAHISRARHGRRLVVEVPSVRLSAVSEHMIEVGYRNAGGERAVERYRAPICRAFEHREVENMDDFKPDADLLRIIESVSHQTGFNPAFTAALIAQESAFNPKSVSFARALGLTQVTPIAETEVSGIFSSWPRYPGLNEVPAPLLKLLVMSGQVNSRNEWRLNPERSIRGGLAFAQMLADHWLESPGYSKISWTGDAPGTGDAEIARTRLILASYNSGYTRVLTAINHYGASWLTAPELKEARKYVNRIFSYCDAFQQGPENSQDNSKEESNENET